MSPRKMNDEGEWVNDDVSRPEPVRRRPSGSHLNAVGWFFLALAILALFVGGVATLGVGLEPGPQRKFVGMLLGGGMLGVVVLLAAILRVLGVPFYRDDD